MYDDIVIGISNQIANLLLKELDIQEKLDHVAVWTAERELILTPVEGWEGKNEDVRKAIKDKTLFEDGQLKILREAKQDGEFKLRALKTKREALSERRRGYEWAIRSLERRDVDG